MQLYGVRSTPVSHPSPQRAVHGAHSGAVLAPVAEPARQLEGEPSGSSGEGADGAVPASYGPLVQRLRQGQVLDSDRSALVDRALAVWAQPGFETFMSKPRLRFEPFPYQLDAAARVLRHMHGRAILADEVGLGKTIEAGLVLSELRLRGLAGRVLVLAPAGLVGQWREELERKFALPCAIADARSPLPRERRDAPIVVASLASARREPLRKTLCAASWDLVIADEAHRLKNARSASAQLARSLRTRYLLLLTATPIENRLSDLFALVSLLRPGLLGSAREFRRRHGSGDGAAARNVASLQLALRELMVRHRRSQISVMLPRRLAETIRVAPTPEEAALYAAISARVRDQARNATAAGVFALRSIQQLAGSSPWACAEGLAKLGFDELAAQARGVRATAKTAALIELLRRHHERGEKVVVFTAFRRTLQALAELAAAHGLDAVVYHGGLGRREKDAAIAAFAASAPVLLSTEAAGEGRNLQFCHVMVNFDLPWNPMQIEQRLGRIHRIGQRHEVLLTNLVAKGTLEERLLAVLQAKINLFELVVGELDMILGRLADEIDFEALVFQEYLASEDDAEFATRMERVGDRLAHARAAHLTAVERVDELVAAQ
jgi:SNF2 family DNA or RNA helicase